MDLLLFPCEESNELLCLNFVGACRTVDPDYMMSVLEIAYIHCYNMFAVTDAYLLRHAACSSMSLRMQMWGIINVVHTQVACVFRCAQTC